MTQFQLFAPADSVSSYGRFVDAVYAAQEHASQSSFSRDYQFGSFESDDEGREFFSFAACSDWSAETFASYVEFLGCSGASLLVA